MTSTPSYPKEVWKQNKRHVNKLKFLSKSLQICNTKHKNMVNFLVVVSYEKKRKKNEDKKREKKKSEKFFFIEREVGSC